MANILGVLSYLSSASKKYLRSLFVTQFILISTFLLGFPLELYLFARDLVSLKLVAVFFVIGASLDLLFFNLLKYTLIEAAFFVIYLLIVSLTVPLLALSYTLPLIAVYFGFFLIKNRNRLPKNPQEKW